MSGTNRQVTPDLSFCDLDTGTLLLVPPLQRTAWVCTRPAGWHGQKEGLFDVHCYL